MTNAYLGNSEAEKLDLPTHTIESVMENYDFPHTSYHIESL